MSRSIIDAVRRHLLVLLPALLARSVSAQCAEQYVLTAGAYPETADHAAAVVGEFGPGASVADWNEIEAQFGADILSFCDAVGLIAYRSQAWCVRGGQAFWSSGRHYFLERHNGSVPSGWLVHDQIGGNLLDLGSWYGSKRILVRLEDDTPPEIDHPGVVVAIDGKGGVWGESVSFSVQVSDACDPDPTLVCTPPSGSHFPRGVTLVTCTATDAAGNVTTSVFPVVVMTSARQHRL